ncbi:hypothetical protein J7384_17085 [Endozoicomonas sp. G2_1]|uniref:hypothetical protein n=1 Tax=Endozoicomonas sp. G2_1 TaxID=2821091 RepID=UPI001ADA25C2|nr:hypothetical protein [Endozoicomonas sp. G2_1]MBO9492079.1 hypothetical protein [Endozoicomonas sp. G2_1]
MSKVVGYKNRFGRILAYTPTLQRNVDAFQLTPVFEGDPEAAELREVIDITAEVVESEEPAKATESDTKASKRRSIVK